MKLRTKKRYILLISAIIAFVVIVLMLIEPNTATFNDGRIKTPPEIEYIHFSIDDCIDIFQDLTTHSDSYTSIFDQEILGFLQQLHNKYGIVCSLYVFYDWDREQPGFDLSMATDKFQDEFIANSDWLKFGFHAADVNSYKESAPDDTLMYYDQTIQALIRIVGEPSLDFFVRLDRYTASQEEITALQSAQYPLKGLLIADRADAETRSSYGLSEEERNICYRNDYYVDSTGMIYTPTDIRLEAIENEQSLYELLNVYYDQKVLTVFTHEYRVLEENVSHFFELIAIYANFYSIKSDFPQNYLG